MVVDWINTFDDPRCIVMNKIDDSLNGNLLLDILKLILTDIGRIKEFMGMISNVESENSQSIKQKTIIDILSKLELNKKIGNNNEKLIEILLSMKLIHDSNSMNNKTIIIDRKEPFKQILEGPKIVPLKKRIVKIESKDKNEEGVNVTTNKPKIDNKSLEKINKFNTLLKNDNKMKKTNQKSSISQDMTISQNSADFKTSLFKESHSRNFKTSLRKQNSTSLVSSSLTESQLKLFTSISGDLNKIYSQRENSELFLCRGIPSQTKINIFNYTFNLIKFTKSTNFITNIDYKSIKKYRPSIKYTKKSIINKNNSHPKTERFLN